MTDPPPNQGPRVSRDEMRDLARLRRSRADRKIAGVAGGIARHLDIDPVIVRVALVVVTLFGGAGLLVYGGLWLLVPEEGSDRAVLSLDDRNRSLAVVGLLGLAGLSLVGDSWGVWSFPWPLVVAGVLVLLLLGRREADQPRVSLSKTPPPGETSYPQAPGWAPPPPRRPADPRRRGPILFWFTAALTALAIGLVGVVDLDRAVPDAAYPAVAVAVCGAMLAVGAFVGRAGGLIAVGLVGTVARAGAAAADRWEGSREVSAPRTAAAVADAYRLDGGELVLDLSSVSDPSELAGDRVDLSLGIGRIEVVLPEGVDVRVTAKVSGPGAVKLPGGTRDGFDVGHSALVRASGPGRSDAVPDLPLLLDLSVGIGEIEVTR